MINERPEHVQYYLIEKIVQALHGKGESPSTGISAARTSRVMDEVVKEYYKAEMRLRAEGLGRVECRVVL